MKNRRKRDNVRKICFYGLVVLLLLGVLSLVDHSSQLNKMNKDLQHIEYVNAGTQRLAKLLGYGYEVDHSLSYLEESFAQILDIGSEQAFKIVRVDNEELIRRGKEILFSWQVLKTMIDETVDVDDLYLISDNLFHQFSGLSALLEEQLELLRGEVLLLQLLLLLIAIFMLLIALHYSLGVRTDLKFHALRTKAASLDEATGLYNRSSCQELLKRANTKENQRSAMIIFDLNDLKKTNDKYGHKIGDLLIFSFAYAVQKASEIHIDKPFIGRYGGDEVIVYYEGVEDEDEVKKFLDKLKEIIVGMNGKENKFQISYAVGYAINVFGNHFSPRELFEEADRLMYRHKVEMKSRGIPENMGGGTMTDKGVTELDLIYEEFLEKHSLHEMTRELMQKEKKRNKNIVRLSCIIIFLLLISLVIYVESKKEYISGNVLYLPDDSMQLPEDKRIGSPWKSNSVANELLFQNLFNTDATLNEVHPGIAASYKVLNDGYTYEITLKEDLYWSDGVELTMADVVFSIESILLGKNVNNYLSIGLNKIMIKTVKK